MRRARTARAGALVLLAGWAGSAGCTHNYYYGNAVPICPDGTAPGLASSRGAVCEVPTQVVGGTVVASGPTAAPDAPPARVVVSEPVDGGPLNRLGSRLSWRRSDPENLATTRVDGAIDEPTVNR